METPDNHLDDLRADHLGEEVRREAEWRRTIARLEGELTEAKDACSKGLRQVADIAGELATAQGRLDCGKDTDCADEIETQAQCLKHYEMYVERGLTKALTAKEEYAAALDRLQQRFNEVWGEKAAMAAALGHGARFLEGIRAHISKEEPGVSDACLEEAMSLRAALSGKSKVWEQVEKAWARVKGTEAYISRSKCGSHCTAENCAIFAMDAALAAMNGV